MEPKFQTSFIPKKPILASQKSAINLENDTNIFSIVANTMFVIVLLASAGLFGYKYMLNSQISKLETEISDARNAFQLDKIQELVDANNRLTASKNLLDKHVAVSKLLQLLETETLKKVKFSDFSYKNMNDSLTISMKAEAATYNAIASQGDVFSKNEFIKTPRFSNFNLMENGKVTADFFSVIDTGLVSYKKSIEALSLNL